MRYPASIHLAVTRAIAVTVADVVAKHPHREGPEMEVCFYPVDHVRPTGPLRFTMDESEADCIPEKG